MLAKYTHSRAAILCFGGWGLQVLFHLLPRLQAAQEQRAALGALGPDLRQITSFAALTAEPHLDGQSRAQFRLFKPQLEPLPPYYIERLLAKLPPDRAAAAGLTAAERRAAALLRAVEPKLTSLTYSRAPFAGPPAERSAIGVRPRAHRSDIFAAALAHADPVARLLETHVLDPIREDNLDPDDPFVQTTLYVVAPLFEPLTSALIWPTVAQLMERSGRRHLSQVVAIFATGSYAADETRPPEDAAAYVALRELELLSGLRAARGSSGRATLTAAVEAANPGLAAVVGQQLFDYIYLVDREKTNQGLAEDSHELAVLAGNAIEALVIASGNLYVQEQIGLGLRIGEERPYSLIGACTDYVPVAQVLHAIHRQEESRLVRDWVLRSMGDDPAERHPLARAFQAAVPGLEDLGFRQESALAALAQRFPDLFQNPSPTGVRDLEVRPAFALPPTTTAMLERLAPERWPAAFEEQVDEIADYLEMSVGGQAVEETWGLQARDLRLATGAWSKDERVFPALVRRMHARLADQVTASPAGLTRAQQQVQRWLTEAEQARQSLLLQSTPSTRQLAQAQRRLALREWQARYDAARAKSPSLGGALLRAAGAVALVALFAWLYLLVLQRPWNPTQDGLALGGFAAGALLAALSAFAVGATRLRRLRRRRTDLALAELNAQVRSAAYDGLAALYTRLLAILDEWRTLLDDARDTLHTLSTPPAMPAAPPPEAQASHLYSGHMSEAVWERCLEQLRTLQDTQGRRSEERLDILWGQADWRRQMTHILQHALLAGGEADDSSPAQTIAEFIRQTVRRSVAPMALEPASPLRAEIIRLLAAEFDIEQMLWRRQAEAEEFQAQLRALETGSGFAPRTVNLETFSRRRYIESAWKRAKPTANYDVSDRLAVYGMTVDFVAAGGAASSDLTRTLADEYNMTLLPTQDPFSATFVRTVHALGLDDLDCIQRYRAELGRLSADARALLLLQPTGAEQTYSFSNTLDSVG